MVHLNRIDEKILEFLLCSGYNSLNLDVFSIRELSVKTKTAYADTYKTIKKLENKYIIKILKQANNKVPIFNYNQIAIGAYVESLKSRLFLQKHKKIEYLLNLLEQKTGFMSYTIIIFGSYAKGNIKKNSDIDVVILSEENNLDKIEKIFQETKRMGTLKFHVHYFSYPEFISMLNNINKINIAKELYKNHIILCGFENYMRCIEKVQNGD